MSAQGRANNHRLSPSKRRRAAGTSGRSSGLISGEKEPRARSTALQLPIAEAVQQIVGRKALEALTGPDRGIGTRRLRIIAARERGLFGRKGRAGENRESRGSGDHQLHRHGNLLLLLPTGRPAVPERYSASALTTA